MNYTLTWGLCSGEEVNMKIEFVELYKASRDRYQYKLVQMVIYTCYSLV